MSESPEQKFVRLANKRVNAALKSIQLVANLSNRGTYGYTQEQGEKIVKALENEVRSCRARFQSESSESSQFRL